MNKKFLYKKKNKPPKVFTGSDWFFNDSINIKRKK